ncbi:hypothetical protein T492DRAFT_913476 [Pavlovales sp. CCMP2436]|nr:hypothetical protein T492DRAFT_913476 [Pavlovales sp. CCMP2436]|mmetsp:Transcript_35662/g.88900  ORF Transcript_35662/g.88900 Transcript_35662/m.88900 type:complete len:100 (+) Transcript_35662:43-342(+)
MTSLYERITAWEERTRHRIHNFRMPIRDIRVLRLVQLGYFVVPIGLGCLLMQAVIRPVEIVHAEIRASPTGRLQQPNLEAQKKELQLILDEAARRHGSR